MRLPCFPRQRFQLLRHVFNIGVIHLSSPAPVAALLFEAARIPAFVDKAGALLSCDDVLLTLVIAACCK